MGIVVALALYLVLVDAAVETVRSGSPLRWWVAGTVAAYFAAAAGVWQLRRARRRSFGWGAHASASFVVLLGLVAATAWLPGGVSAGVTAFGLPTPTLLEAVAAAGVVLAGLVFLRLPGIPVAVKVSLAALAAYGAAGFGYGAVAGTPISMLLAGQSVWQRLPTVLQGAFLGGLVVLPLALLVSIVRAGLRRPQPDSLKRTLHECVALATSVAIVLAGVPLPTALAGRPATGDHTAHSLTTTEVAATPSTGARPLFHEVSTSEKEQLSVELGKGFLAIDALAAAIPADSYDPQSALARIGTQPVAIFHWVRDHTFNVNYRGVLRGALGVLMDRRGNSLDRALLLADLLRRGGYEVRLAHGLLSDIHVRELSSAMSPKPAAELPSTPDSPPEIDALIGHLSQDFPGSEMTLRRAAEDARARAFRMGQGAVARSAAQMQAVAAAAGLAASSENERQSVEASDVDALRDHWWVQWHQGSAWTDFDPAEPGSEPGHALADAELTIDPDKLDGALYHEVQIQITMERWTEGHLVTTSALTQVLRPSELLGVRVALVHIPVLWPPDLNLFEEVDSLARLTATALDQHEWLPVLQVGTNQFAQFSFTDSGLLNRAGPIGRLGSGIGRAFEGAMGALAQPTESSRRGRLTAEWIDYEIRSPGSPAHKIRRELFDLLGPAARTRSTVPEPTITETQRREMALAMFGQTDILLLSCQVTRDFVAHLLAVASQANRQPFQQLLAASDSKAFQEAASTITPLPTPLYNLALARSDWNRHRDDVYLDRSNILSGHQLIREDPQGNLLGTYCFDIVANYVAVTGSKADARLVRLEQGVVDTNAEAALASVARVQGSTISRPSNTSEIYPATSDQSGTWVTLRGSEESALQRLALRTDVRSRIAEDLAAGYVIVAPSRPVPFDGRAVVGWWRINPQSGETLGIGEQGWGDALPSFGLMLWKFGILAAHTAVCAHHAAEMKSATKENQEFNGVVALTACVVAGSFSFAGALGWGAGPLAGFGPAGISSTAVYLMGLTAQLLIDLISYISQPLQRHE